MEGFGAVIAGILEVGLAPVLLVLLLWKGLDLANKFYRRLYELMIGLQIIIEKLDATDEYREAIRQLKVRESDE